MKIILISAIILTFFVACSDNNDTQDPEKVTKTEKGKVIESYHDIFQKIDSLTIIMQAKPVPASDEELRKTADTILIDYLHVIRMPEAPSKDKIGDEFYREAAVLYLRLAQYYQDHGHDTKEIQNLCKKVLKGF